MANGKAVDAGGAVQDFLHPKSMLTPGIAGGIVMGISTSVGPAVGLDPLHCILGLSFLVGLVVFVTTSNLLLKLLYYLLNSLIICTMALGMFVNAKGGAISSGAKPPSEVIATETQSDAMPPRAITVTTVELPAQAPIPVVPGK